MKWTGPDLPESIGSPVIVGDLLYRVTGYNDLKCLRVEDGTEVYEKDLDGISTSWASPVVDPHGRIYLANAGRSYVVQSGAEFKVLAVNDLGDGNPASPAVADGKLFLVGMNNVYCIGRRGDR